MEHQLNILDWFNKKWPEYVKRTPFITRMGNRSGHAIAFEVGSLRVLFGTMMGPKGGITGVLVVVDTSKSVEIDKLLCSNLSIMRSERIIIQLNITVHVDKMDFEKVAPAFLTDTMHEWENNPGLITTIADEIGFGQPSVGTLSGGAVSPR